MIDIVPQGIPIRNGDRGCDGRRFPCTTRKPTSQIHATARVGRRCRNGL